MSLGIACWLARNDESSRATKGLVAAMFFYNVVVVVILFYSRFGLKLSGMGLWPAIIVHIVLAGWGIFLLRTNRSLPSMRFRLTLK